MDGRGILLVALATGGMGEKQSELWAWDLQVGVGGLGGPSCLLRAAFWTFLRCENQDVNYSLEVLHVKTVCQLPMVKELLKRFQGEHTSGGLELPRHFSSQRRNNGRSLERKEKTGHELTGG